MDKRKLLSEVKKEIESSKKEAVRRKLKDMLVEIEMAKATVTKLEKKFEAYLSSKDEDIIFEIEDEEWASDFGGR